LLQGAAVRACTAYAGKTKDTNFLSASGVLWAVSSMTVVNLYGAYTFGNAFGVLGFKLKLGVRNLFDRSPVSLAT
jgi:iron complex outermembrane recepter protein